MTREVAIAILDMSKHMATSGRMYNQAIDMAIEALSEPINENREIIKDILQMMPTAYLLEALGVATFDELMDSERTGEWEYCEHEIANNVDGYKCSHCGFFAPWDYEHKFIDFIKEYHFCPNCGAMMVEKDGVK